VLDLGKKIDETWVIASGEKESSVEDLVRFDLIRQGFAADRFSFSKDGVFVVLDGTMGIVMSANVKNKEMKVLAGKGESLGWVDVLFDSNKSLVLYKSGVGVAGDKEVIKFDSAVSNALAMVKFGSNLYVLDQGNREIYKYIATDNGYGERSRWLKQNESLDITPVDFAIDSDIWVVDEKGKIERFRRGNKEQFSIIGMPEEVRVSRIAVEQTGNKIALLDTSVGRVIFCDKESGNCNSQLKSEKIKTATDIEYDSDGVLNLLFPGSIGVLR